MLATVLAVVLSIAQPPVLTSGDVAQIMSVSIRATFGSEPTSPGRSAPRPLIIDAAGATETFATLGSKPLGLDTAQWVRSEPREFRRTLEALNCPNARVSPACRLRKNGTVVHVLDARPVPNSSAIELWLNVITPNHHASDGRLSGFTAVLRVEKVAGVWTAQIERVAA